MSGPFEFRASLTGMDPKDCFHLVLPSGHSRLSIGQLLDRLFPEDEDEREAIASAFDLRANPDLPEIYGVFLDVMEEWRQGRCLLAVSAGETEDAALASRVSTYLETAPAPGPAHTAPYLLNIHVEQRYHAVDYAARSEFWGSKDELLDWLRSMTLLYFLDKYEVELPVVPVEAEDQALVQITDLAQHEGLIAKSEDGSILEMSEEGKLYIDELLAETESYIDLYEHFRDTFMDVDSDRIEFETGKGIDLRVQVFGAESLDPVRTVFLLRLYDGSLDEHLPEWKTRVHEEEFFDSILEPAVNRYDVGDDLIGWVCEHGFAYLEERREKMRELEEQRAVRRRVRRSLPRS